MNDTSTTAQRALEPIGQTETHPYFCADGDSCVDRTSTGHVLIEHESVATTWAMAEDRDTRVSVSLMRFDEIFEGAQLRGEPWVKLGIVNAAYRDADGTGPLHAEAHMTREDVRLLMTFCQRQLDLLDRPMQEFPRC